MKIKLYWPNCTLNFRGVEFNGHDAIFLECSLEEAKEQLFDRLTEEQIDKCLRDYDPHSNHGQLKFGIETDKSCFLVTKDKNVLLPEPWYFPSQDYGMCITCFRKTRKLKLRI